MSELIRVNIHKRKMDMYDLKFIKEVKLYGQRLNEFNNAYSNNDTSDTYAVHIYQYKLNDITPVQVALVLYKGECIEYFIREYES